MPDPKDYIDGKYQFVQGYVRRKHGTDITQQPKRVSWFWRIAWYWRTIIIIGGITLFFLFVSNFDKPFNPYTGAIVAIVFWYWFWHPTKSKSHSGNSKTARRIWRKII